MHGPTRESQDRQATNCLFQSPTDLTSWKTDWEPLDFDRNVPEDIRRATLELKADRRLTIRQADKGSCLVVLDTSDYIREGMEHLTDAKIYKRVDHNKTAHKANWICRHYSITSVLTAAKSSKLTNTISEVRTQQLYFLRKVHRSPHKIRPIVSCSSGPTEKLSGHLCAVLSAHLDNVHSLVRNSQQAVTILDSIDLSSHRDVMLVSLDVESLYLSIPQGAGIEEVLQRIVHTIPATSRVSEYKNFLRDSLRVVIRDNHFAFHDSYFDQVRGVAMGTKCAPPFANLFLVALEERALEKWRGTAPKAWLRFLDDVLMLWTGGVEQLSTTSTARCPASGSPCNTLGRRPPSLTWMSTRAASSGRLATWTPDCTSRTPTHRATSTSPPAIRITSSRTSSGERYSGP